jgi:glycosyltransferase involved in cell wall biosynthesis
VADNRKKILIVKPIVPFPPDQGTRVVSFDLIRTLQRDFDVTVLTRLLDPAEENNARSLEKHCSRVVTVMAPNRKSIVHRAAYKLAYLFVSLFRRRSLKSLYECPGVFVRAARRLAQEDFDCVVVEYWQLHRLLDEFPEETVVLLTHDIEMLVNRQNALLERNLFRKLVKVRRWLLEQREEIHAYRRARRVLALTERDATAVRKIRSRDPKSVQTPPTGDGVSPDDAVGVLPFGLDVETYTQPVGERDPREILFMGALRAGFNRDALEYFVQKVFPHLDELRDIKITVVGGDLPRHLEYFGRDDRVEVTGRVPDVRPYLARAGCLVVPLRFGGGLRIRILEAMMAGTPIVCSTVAIAGMEFQPNREYLLADTPADTATEIRRLLDDPSLGSEIARNAATAVRERYERDAQSRRTAALFRYIVSYQ